MSNNNKTKYFATEDSNTLARKLLDKADAIKKSAISSQYLDKIYKSWQYYHGYFFKDDESHSVTYTGEQGELVQLPVNHYRNIADHIINMIMASRPSFQARSVNTDYKSLTQTYLANGLLEYYLKEKNLEDHLKRAVTYAVVLTEGYIKMEWDSTSGEIYDYEINEETGTQIPIYEGDIKYTNLSPLDVIRDSSKEDSSQHNWIMCRSYKNRFDLAAKYPEISDKILEAPTKSDLIKFKVSSLKEFETDDIEVWEFYHKKSDSLPDGRYCVFVSPEAILYDGPLPYPEIPLYRIAASDILGTPFGSTIMFELMPLQESLNSLYSVILTNQNAFGVQNILIPKGSDINLASLSGGLNIIEYNQAGAKPEPLNLVQTPAEIFNMIDRLEQAMETISGINSVTRGQPEASLRSASSLAMVQAQAIQFANGLQQSYIRLVENVGTGTIRLLQLFAKVPRVAAIVGKSQKANLEEFSGDDLASINRVAVEVANPLSRTTAGRLEIANQLIQMGLINNVEEYFTVLNTGKLETLVEGQQSELLLIRKENEKMMSGETVPALSLDKHQLHVMEHKALLNDPDLRADPNLVQIVLDHIREHVNLLRVTDPGELALTNQQPLPPNPAEQPIGPEGANIQEDETIPPELMDQVPVGTEAAQNIASPRMPSPPEPFQDLPVTAEEGLNKNIG